MTYTVRFEIPQGTAAEGIVKADVRLEVWISYQLSSVVLYILLATENPSQIIPRLFPGHYVAFSSGPPPSGSL